MSVTSLYIPNQINQCSIYQKSYTCLFKCLKKHWNEEILNEMTESLQWKLTPTADKTMKMTHKETGEEHNEFFMFIGSYKKSTEIFSWSDLEKEIIKDFIETNYDMSEYLGNASCFITELFSDTIHIKKEDHMIIPTFIRMFHKIFRLVRIITDDADDTKYYYGLIKYDFKDHTNFDKFELGLSLFRDSVDIQLHMQQQKQEQLNDPQKQVYLKHPLIISINYF